MAHAWITDLGPALATTAGGWCSPEELVAARSTLTGEHLAVFVG